MDTYEVHLVIFVQFINSGVSFAVLAAGDQAVVFDVLIHILAFLGYCE